jgi:hypothetical protein
MTQDSSGDGEERAPEKSGHRVYMHGKHGKNTASLGEERDKRFISHSYCYKQFNRGSHV